MARLPLPTPVFTVWTIGASLRTPPHTHTQNSVHPYPLYSCFCISLSSCQWHHLASSPRKAEKDKQGHACWSCVYSIVLKDEPSIWKTPTLFWHGVATKAPLLICPSVFLWVCAWVGLDFSVWTAFAGEKKWKCAEASSLTLCVYLCLIYYMGVFNRCVCGSWRVWRLYMPAVWGAWLHCN